MVQCHAHLFKNHLDGYCVLSDNYLKSYYNRCHHGSLAFKRKFNCLKTETVPDQCSKIQLPREGFFQESRGTMPCEFVLFFAWKAGVSDGSARGEWAGSQQTVKESGHMTRSLIYSMSVSPKSQTEGGEVVIPDTGVDLFSPP